MDKKSNNKTWKILVKHLLSRNFSVILVAYIKLINISKEGTEKVFNQIYNTK